MRYIFLPLMLIFVFLDTNAQDGKQCDPAKEKPTRKNTKAKNGESYGAVIDRDGSMDVSLLNDKMKTEQEIEVKIKGTISTVCQVKGCWMTTALGTGTTMRIRFKDYAFFVPKDAHGKTFYAKGVASWNVTSVAQLRHYAEDAGKSKEEIEQINEPKRELVFLAEGVLIEKK